jgi:hypothetical protein
VCLLFAPPARATDDDESDPAVEIHGFVSQGAIKTSHNNYLASSKVGSLEFSEAGLNFTKALGEKLRVGLQLFARDLGPIGDYKPQLDWYYLDYRVIDELGLRVGRLKLPLGLYNETSDIDSARVPVLLPQSVYSIRNRDYLLAQTGGELYGFVSLGAGGALDYRLYGGSIFIDVPSYSAAGATSVEIPYLFGSRLMWHAPLQGLRLGASAQRLRLDLDYSPSRDLLPALMPPPNSSGTYELRLPVTIGIASLEYAADDFLLSVEYIRQWVEIEGQYPGLDTSNDIASEGYYAMVSYHVTPWFAPGVYYTVRYPNVDDRRGREAYQHDLALSFRYDLTQNWLLKIEGHYMSGTAGLREELNENRPLRTLSRDWGVLLAKTTAYF